MVLAASQRAVTIAVDIKDWRRYNALKRRDAGYAKVMHSRLRAVFVSELAVAELHKAKSPAPSASPVRDAIRKGMDTADTLNKAFVKGIKDAEPRQDEAGHSIWDG